MTRGPARSTRTDTLFPYTTLFRSTGRGPQAPLVVAPSKGDPDPGAVPSRRGRPRAGRGRVVRRGGPAGRSARRSESGRRFPVAPRRRPPVVARGASRSEEHTSELQSLMRISYAVFCLEKKNN